jgi:hypothetical protein
VDVVLVVLARSEVLGDLARQLPLGPILVLCGGSPVFHSIVHRGWE